MKKRIPAVMTAVLLAVSTAACGGSGTAETGSTGQAPSETAAYYTDQIITPSEFASYDEFSLGEMRIVDGSVRAYGYAYDEDYNLTSFLCSFQPDGSDFRLQELDTGDNSIDYTAIDADGNFYMVLSSYSGQGEEEEDASWADTAAEYVAGSLTGSPAGRRGRVVGRGRSGYICHCDFHGLRGWRRSLYGG